MKHSRPRQDRFDHGPLHQAACLCIHTYVFMCMHASAKEMGRCEILFERIPGIYLYDMYCTYLDCMYVYSYVQVSFVVSKLYIQGYIYIVRASAFQIGQTGFFMSMGH